MSAVKAGLTLGVVGLGRMGLNMVYRLQTRGVDCVVFDHNPEVVKEAEGFGATGAHSLPELVEKLPEKRAIWLMIPTAVVSDTLAELKGLLGKGDIIIDGGNSHYTSDIQRANALREAGIDYVDVGVSGGVWGRERGYCQMIGGPEAAYTYLEPAFAALAPGVGTAERSEGREGDPASSEQGYLYCGPNGAGHFVKMVHNGIEYGLMAAYAEGLNILKHANVGNQQRSNDAETSPLEVPEHYQYDLPIGEIAEVWRRGSVIGSWLLDLTANELHRDPSLEAYAGRVSDSGEGRWTAVAAIEEGVPAPVLSAALFARFDSRDHGEYADKVLSAMRHSFGGHAEKSANDKD